MKHSLLRAQVLNATCVSIFTLAVPAQGQPPAGSDGTVSLEIPEGAAPAAILRNGGDNDPFSAARVSTVLSAEWVPSDLAHRKAQGPAVKVEIPPGSIPKNLESPPLYRAEILADAKRIIKKLEGTSAQFRALLGQVGKTMDFRRRMDEILKQSSETWEHFSARFNRSHTN